jgi:hypothetical protein
MILKSTPKEKLGLKSGFHCWNQGFNQVAMVNEH